METCPRGNWICSSSPPDAWHSRAQIRRRSCGASFLISNRYAESFTISQTALSCHPPNSFHLGHTSEYVIAVDSNCRQPNVQTPSGWRRFRAAIVAGCVVIRPIRQVSRKARLRVHKITLSKQMAVTCHGRNRCQRRFLKPRHQSVFTSKIQTMAL